MTFWAMFIGLVMVPMMALSIEVGRFLIARAQISTAADAAALAAAVEINTRLLQETGVVALPSSNTQAWAQRIVNENCTGLRSLGINPRIGSIVISGNTVQVFVSANLDLLFPDFVPELPVTEIGKAEVRVLDH